MKKFIIIRLGSSSFAVALANVREVLGLKEVAALPNMPTYFAGLINLRGKIVSVVDLKKSLKSVHLSVSEERIKRSCIVMIEVSHQYYGAIVDDIVEVLSVDESQIEPAPDSLAGSSCFLGVLKVPQKPIAPILDLAAALRLDELLKISASASRQVA
ncbi:MAG: chemotaxis protein CheW [Bdellovibrionia bacterium]